MNRDTGYRFLDPAELARVKNLSLVARGVVEGSITGLHASPYHGFSVEFSEHRKYAPGDNLRHLDWRTLARTDRLYVKQYEEETNLKAQILLDTSGSMLYRSDGAISKFEYGAYLTAVLGYLMTRQQDAVGLTTFDSEVRLDMPARSSPRHFGDMMQQLEAVCELFEGFDLTKPGESTNIAGTMHKLAERFKRRRLIILISDLYDDPEAVIRALHHFRHRHHEVILFHVFDQAEIELPFRETLRFVDLETGERLQVDPAYVRRHYQQQIQEFIATYKKSCTECQIDYVMTDTSVTYGAMLSRYLASRNER